MTYKVYRRKKAAIYAVSFLFLAAGMVFMAADCDSLAGVFLLKVIMLGCYILAGVVFNYGERFEKRHRYYSGRRQQYDKYKAGKGIPKAG